MDVNLEIKKTKEQRQQLDAVLQNIRTLNSSRETSLAITKVQEAIM